jgi:hypothetical protein
MEGLHVSIDAMSACCLLERYIGNIRTYIDVINILKNVPTEDEGEGTLDALPCSFPIPKDLERFDYGIVKDYIKVYIKINL